MKQLIRSFAAPALALLAALFVAATPAQLEAQSSTDENLSSETVPEAPEIERGELEDFAVVYLQVMEIRDTFEDDVEAAATQAEAQELQATAQEAMREILAASDFTIERYTQIGQILQTDPEQRAEFEAIVRDIQSEGTS